MRATIEAFLAASGLEWEPGARDDEYVVALPGEKKLKTIASLVVSDTALSVSAFVIRNPDENHAEVYRFLLRRNLRLQEALVADGDRQGFMALDGQMHEMMLSFTGFPRLPQVAQTAWLSVHRARQLILPVKGRLQATLEEHRAILAAFEAHDPDAARRAVQHHLRQLLTYLVPLERAHPELFAAP